MRKNAALVVAFLCCFLFVMPWGAVVDDPFYIHTLSIGASLCLVIACYFLSSRMWSVAVQIIETLCVIYQAEVVINWNNQDDKFYIYHDEFMLCAFLLELIIIFGSLDKIAAAIDGIADSFRRTFLAVVSLYPAQHIDFTLFNTKENRLC